MTSTKHQVARIVLGFGAAVFLGIASVWGETYSHARIVRLSFVEGTVSIQRPDIADWAQAPINTPLQEGFKLSTAEGSFAEVEFENGSTIRLGQLSLLEFSQLALASDGSKINRFTLDRGYATFHAIPEGEDVYEVRTLTATLTPHGKVIFRIDIDPSGERVEDFHGSLEVASSLGAWTLAKNSSLELRPGTDQPSQISEGITQDDWDRWVQERESRAEVAHNGPSPRAYINNAGDAYYGWSDLSYFGNWSYMSGMGWGWIPSAGAGWSPYVSGSWVWYPGFGYTWISGDPWGWLPYHCGWWDFSPGWGWMWFPGSCGMWSPAMVTWYAGPGWIGWTPQFSPHYGGRAYPCPHGRACGAAVSNNALQTGRPVSPGNVLSVDLASGERIERPDISPDRQAMLPGRVVPPPAGLANSRLTPQAAGGATTLNREPTKLAPSAAFAPNSSAGGSATGLAPRLVAPGPKSEIVYDPVEGRYVNRPRPTSGVVGATNEPSSGSQPSTPTTTSVPGQAQTSPPLNPSTSATPGSGAANAPARPATLPIRPLHLAPTAGAASEIPNTEPSTGASQKAGPTAPAQSHSDGSLHGSAPRSETGSSKSSRGGGSAPSGRASAGGGSSGSGASSGGSWGGGGGMGGGSHGGGGSSAGPHR